MAAVEEQKQWLYYVHRVEKEVGSSLTGMRFVLLRTHGLLGEDGEILFMF